MFSDLIPGSGIYSRSPRPYDLDPHGNYRRLVRYVTVISKSLLLFYTF